MCAFTKHLFDLQVDLSRPGSARPSLPRGFDSDAERDELVSGDVSAFADVSLGEWLDGEAPPHLSIWDESAPGAVTLDGFLGDGVF